LLFDGWRREYDYNSLRFTARKENRTWIFTAYQEDAEQPLIELAQSLAEQEAKYLPTMRYFNAHALAFNENLKAELDKIYKRLSEMGNEIHDLKRREISNWDRASESSEAIATLRAQFDERIRALEDQVEQHRQELQDDEETLTDFGDCLDKDHARLNRIELVLGKHLRQALAHFPCVGKRIILEKV